MKRVSSAVVSVTGLLAACGVAAAQTDTLYVTDGDSARLAIVQGGSLQGVKTTHVRGYSIVARDSLWIGDYNGNQPNAIEYDLAGNPTGNAVPYTPRFAVDAGTDGKNNYELGNAFGGTAQVWMSDGDFQNATQLFSVFGNDLVGITFDMASGTLWISDQNNIYNYTTGGALLGQFAHQSSRGSLAWEPSTDTLWYIRNGSDTIDQYSKAGTLLQSVSVSGLASNNWGAEFVIPAPGVLGLAGLAGLAAIRRRR